MERPQRQCWLRIVIPDKAIKVGGYDGALGVGGDAALKHSAESESARVENEKAAAPTLVARRYIGQDDRGRWIRRSLGSRRRQRARLLRRGWKFIERLLCLHKALRVGALPSLTSTHELALNATFDPPTPSRIHAGLQKYDQTRHEFKRRQSTHTRATSISLRIFNTYQIETTMDNETREIGVRWRNTYRNPMCTHNRNLPTPPFNVLYNPISPFIMNAGLSSRVAMNQNECDVKPRFANPQTTHIRNHLRAPLLSLHQFVLQTLPPLS
jgi:hypothetical protein